MSLVHHLLLLVSLAPAAPVLGAPAGVEQQVCTYRVVADDYCWGIATSKHRMTLEQLYQLNPERRAGGCLIFPGDELRLACGSQRRPPPPHTLKGECRRRHTVQPGDSCWAIAVRQSIGLDLLRAWNWLGDEYALQAGQDLCVAAVEEPRCGRKHEAIAGDTCWHIANRSKSSLDELVRLNPNLLEQRCSLFPGQSVCVVGGDDTPHAKRWERPGPVVGAPAGSDFIGNRTSLASLPQAEVSAQLAEAREAAQTNSDLDGFEALEGGLFSISNWEQ